MPVYIPLGHGNETFSQSRHRDIVPPGCSVTVIETPGSTHYWRLMNSDGKPANNNKGEIFEYTQLANFLTAHPDKRGIFDSPKENAEEINDIFGSVAIFGPGEKYPNIDYDLKLEWKYNGKYTGLRYSGLVDLDTFTSPDFTTHHIISKLPHPTLPLKHRYTVEKNDEWIENQEEIYRYSLYPSPDLFKKYFSSTRGVKQYYIDTNNPEAAAKVEGDLSNTNWIRVGKSDFDDEEDGYIRVSLRKLMTLFPGNYIHMVCRGSDNDTSTYQMEEILTKRVPLMSERQMTQMLNTPKILDNIKNRGSRNTRTLMKNAMRKSLAQRELLRKVKRQEGGRRTRRHRRTRGT